MSFIGNIDRIGVDFSPADAVAMSPYLQYAGVLHNLGGPFQAALRPAEVVLPGHAPRSYCELLKAACANAQTDYDILLPTPSSNCGGCRKGHVFHGRPDQRAPSTWSPAAANSVLARTS